MIEKLKIEKECKVPIETVWLAISNIDGLERWFPAIQHCQIEGQGVGAIRTLTLLEGGIIRDIVEEINHDKQQFSYKRIEHPFPLSHYQGRVNMSSISPRKTKLSWSIEYRVLNENRSEMSSLLQNVITDGISGLEQDLCN